MAALSALFDRYAAINPPPPYWLSEDDGADYCRKHAEKKAAEIGCEVDGGYHREMDSCCHCAVCGKLLDYTLTGHGQDAEIDHFRNIKFRRGRPLDKVTAYHLARAFYGKDDDLEAVEIAARAIRCMRSVPKLTE